MTKLVAILPLAAIEAALAVAPGTALAADFPPGDYYAAPAPIVSGWAGPYLGANAGYQWGSVSNSPTKPSGIVGGVEGGYNWQSGRFVYGAETDLELSGADATVAPVEFSTPWLGTLRGRGGIAFSNVLVFGTAGLAYGDLRADTTGLTEAHTSIGWVAGGGVEVGFAPRWTAKAEWLYLDLAGRNFSVTSTTNGLAANLLRVGVNYHF